MCAGWNPRRGGGAGNPPNGCAPRWRTLPPLRHEATGRLSRPAVGMPVVFQSREAMLLFRFLPDAYTQLLIGLVLLAHLLPARGPGASACAWQPHVAIALLCFLDDARLSNKATLAGATHWRPHLLIFACTFALFPPHGLALKPLLLPLLGEE